MSVTLGPVNPSKDQQIWSVFNTTNFGSAVNASIGAGDTIRFLVGFDISSIPVYAKVLAVTLKVHVNSLIGSPIPTYKIYRVTRREWVEAQATWDIYSTGNNWTTAGGDFTTDDEAGPYAAPGGTGAINHTDAQIIAQVQTGVQQTTDRIAAFLFDPDDGGAGQIRVSTKENVTASERPELTVIYVVPKRRALLGVGR